MEAPYRSIGIISSRIGATGQIIAVDDAVKETNTKVLSIMLPRDTKGGGGHGNYIVIGAETVADARKAVELTLEKTKKNAGEIYVSSAGHLEMAFSPRADQALELAFGIPHGKAFGFVCGCPAANWHGDGGSCRKISRRGNCKIHDPKRRHQPHE